MGFLGKSVTAVALLGSGAMLVSGVYEAEQVTARPASSAASASGATTPQISPGSQCQYLQGTLLWRADVFEGCADDQAKLSDFIKSCYMDGLQVTVPVEGHLLCDG